MRVGWYREVTVKGLDCQAVRALLVARAQIVSQITTLKNCVRGILKTFGRVLAKGLRSQFPGRVRAAIDGHPVLGAIILGGGILRNDAQALSIRRGGSRRAHLQMRRRHGARLSVRGSQSFAQSVGAAKRAEDLG